MAAAARWPVTAQAPEPQLIPLLPDLKVPPRLMPAPLRDDVSLASPSVSWML